MAIVDDFAAIKAAMERSKPSRAEMCDTFAKLSLEEQEAVLANPDVAKKWTRSAVEAKAPKPKHPLLLEAVIAHQRSDRAELLPSGPIRYVEARLYTKEELVTAWRRQLDNGMFANFPGSMFAKKGNAE